MIKVGQTYKCVRRPACVIEVISVGKERFTYKYVGSFYRGEESSFWIDRMKAAVEQGRYVLHVNGLRLAINKMKGSRAGCTA